MENVNPTVYKVAGRAPKEDSYEYENDLEREEITADEIFGE